MAAQIVSLFQTAPERSRDWTQQEIAEFYRVEGALIQAGVPLESDRGVSDEGDPWFIFCRADNGDVFIHFARIDGFYVVDGVAFETPARGRDFGDLVRSLLAHYPVAAARARNNANIFVHPAALLIALVGAAFFQTNEAKAATTAPSETKTEPRRSSLIVTASNSSALVSSGALQQPAEIDSGQAAAILLSAILTAQDDIFASVARTSPAVQEAPITGLQGLDSSLNVSGSLLAPPSTIDMPARIALSVENLGEAAPANTALPGPSPANIIADPSAQVALGQTERQSPIASTPVLPEPAENTASKPFFFITAASGPLPTIEAISIVTSNAALAEMVAKALPQVDRLPSSILDLISRGDHLDATSAALNAPDISVVRANPGNGATEKPASQPSGVASDHQTTPAPIVGPSDAGQTSPQAAVQSNAAKIHDAAISAALTDFMAHVPHLDLLLQGNQLIIYDRDIFDPLAGRMDLNSVTITFEDGSSLSLVGTIADLSHFNWPG